MDVQPLFGISILMSFVAFGFRPPRLTNKPLTGKYRTALGQNLSSRVNHR